MYLSSFNDFLKDNALYLALGVVALIIIVIILIFVFKKKEPKTTKIDIYNGYLEAFGSINNVISSSSRGSRLSLVLRDYDLLDNEKLESFGFTSSIRMSNKITFVTEEAESICIYINDELTRLSNED